MLDNEVKFPVTKLNTLRLWLGHEILLCNPCKGWFCPLGVTSTFELRTWSLWAELFPTVLCDVNLHRNLINGKVQDQTRSGCKDRWIDSLTNRQMNNSMPSFAGGGGLHSLPKQLMNKPDGASKAPTSCINYLCSITISLPKFWCNSMKNVDAEQGFHLTWE